MWPLWPQEAEQEDCPPPSPLGSWAPGHGEGVWNSSSNTEVRTVILMVMLLYSCLSNIPF